MTVSYQQIRTGAWLPTDPDTCHTAPYLALPFPEEWRDTLLNLCNAGRRPGSEPYRTVPTYRFEQALQAFAPDVLVMPRPFHQRAEDEPARWLYAPEGTPDPLPPDALRTLVNHWLGDLRSEPEHRGLLREARAQLAASPPQWERVERELLRCPVTTGGTAAPLAHQFQLTTDWLSRRIVALGPYPHDAGHLHFRTVPRSVFDKGAQLVSQPLAYDTERGSAWYSIVLDITLQTVPFDPLPRFHLHWSIRRWATRVNPKTGRLHLPYGRKATVLLRPRVPYLPGAPRSERYAVARVERRWEEDGGWQGGWAQGGPARILRGVSLGEPFPEADDVLTDPESWLQGDFRAGVVHSTAMGGHAVKAGLMSHQRSQLTEWAEQALPAELRTAPALVRTRRADPKPVNAPPTSVKAEAKPAEQARRAAERRASAAYAVSCLTDQPAPDALHGPETLPVLEARLLWQTAEMRQAATDALVAHLGLTGTGSSFTEDDHKAARPGTPVVLEWQTSELAVRLRCLPFTDGLPDSLPIPEGARRTREVAAAAVHTRRVKAAEWLRADATGDAPALALVEIDRQQDFVTRDHDPKFALRLGCADAGFVTQFMVVPKKAGRYDSVRNMAHRALMAWDDGLRQLGVRVHPEHGLGDRLPAGLRFTAVWLVRKNRTAGNRWAAHVPVAVLVTPQAPGSGIARVQGWDPDAHDGAGAWIPYPAMLLRLTRRAEVGSLVPAPRDEEDAVPRPTRRSHRDRQQRETEEWLQGVRNSLRREPTLLLVHAQNARSHWTWLQDGRVEPDRIRDGQAGARRLAPETRLVRVRSRQGRETPQWWGLHPKEGPNGLPAHLWTAEGDRPGRVFYSTTPKPVQFKSSAVEADKLAPRPLRAGPRKGELTVDTGTPGWSPTLMEVAVLGCHEEDGDDPESLALAVHQLRQPPDYPEALSLPLPLHLACLGQEYVLPTRPEGDGDTEEPAPAVADAGADPSAADVEDLGDDCEPEEEEGQLSLFGA